MTKLGIFGAMALSLSLAIATPVLAQQSQGGRTGMHASGANVGGARIGGAGPRVQSNFRGAQTSVGRSDFGGRGNAQFAQGAYRGGEFRGDRGRGFGRDIAAGVVAGAAVASGAYGYGYSDPYYGDNYAYGPDYYGDSYAYDNGVTFDSGLPIVTFGQPAPVEGPMVASGDASYCAQRYRSYDPASGTYLGFDGLRHPCL
jgi:BA14K-like protein